MYSVRRAALSARHSCCCGGADRDVAIRRSQLLPFVGCSLSCCMQRYPNAPIVLRSNSAFAVTNTFLGAR